MSGFGGLLRGELSRWAGRRGLFHLIGWTVLIQGQLYLEASGAWSAYGAFWGFDLVVHLLWLFPTLGAIAVSQGLIGEERVWGTVGWVMARPVSRPAFVVAKVVGTAAPLILLAVVLQGALAYVWLPGVDPDRGFAAATPDLGRYAVVLGVLSLLVVLFVALAVALGTVFHQRAVVAGVSLVTFLVFVVSGDRSDVWREWFPGGLVGGMNEGADYKQLSVYLFGGSLDGAPAVWVAVAAVVALTGVAAWRFSTEEL